MTGCDSARELPYRQQIGAVLVWLTCLWMGHAFAFAQEFEGLPANPALPMLPAPNDEGYWIVSARECAGELGPSQCKNLKIWKSDATGTGRTVSLDEFLRGLTPRVPLCLMIHGSFVDWETIHRDSRHTNDWLRSAVPGGALQVVFFTWPSDDTPRVWLPADVSLLGRRAARYGFYLAELISLIPDDRPICLVGHSHGGRMVVSTMHLLAGGRVDGVAFGGGPYHRHRIRAVLAAAAFDHDWLNPGRLYERAVERPEGILNLVNRRDLALGLYPLHRPLLTSAAVARSGFTRGDRQEIGVSAGKIIDYDITERVRAGHIWPHYYGDRGLARVIAPYVFFLDTEPRDQMARQPRAVQPSSLLQVESHRDSKWIAPQISK